LFTSTDISNSITTIESAITVTQETANSHVCTMVYGLEHPKPIQAIGIYLAACISTAIKANLEIALDLTGSSPNELTQLRNTVHRIIGPDNQISNIEKETRRNPWITEGLAHLCAMLSRKQQFLFPAGRIEALNLVHSDVTDHGLDHFGIFHRSKKLGVSIGECKTSDKDISGNLTDASTKFHEVINGIHDPRIRTHIQYLRASLPSEIESLITQTFWKEKQLFTAYISYPEHLSFNAKRRRPTFENIQGSPSSVNVISFELKDFDAFFNNLSDAIRQAI
jgi:hypothetical protein